MGEPENLSLYVVSRSSESVKVLVAQSCPTLGDPMDCKLSGSSVHGILQTRIMAWVSVPFSRESFRPRDIEPGSPALQADSLLSEPPGKIKRCLK